MRQNRHTTQVLERVAEHNGTTVEAVRQEINRVIEIGMRNPDEAIREKWATVPCEGDVPTPEELITYVVKEAAERAISIEDIEMFAWMRPDAVEVKTAG